jgi:hypothetical protein
MKATETMQVRMKNQTGIVKVFSIPASEFDEQKHERIEQQPAPVAAPVAAPEAAPVVAPVPVAAPVPPAPVVSKAKAIEKPAVRRSAKAKAAAPHAKTSSRTHNKRSAA